MAVEIPCNSLTDNLELMKDEIHVFHVSLDLSPALRKQLEETLSDDERRRAAHFHFEKDRNRFVTGRGFLRKILGWLLRLPPSSLIFCYGPHGKPQLAAPTVGHLLHFNVAHSDSIGVYAVRHKSADFSAPKCRLGFAHKREGGRRIEIYRRSVGRDFRPLPFHADRGFNRAGQGFLNQRQMAKHAAPDDWRFDL